MHYKIIPVTHYQQNCSVIWCEETRKAALVDPGGEVPKLLAAVADLGLTLEKVLLTHGHMDHVGGTAAVVAATGVPVEGPHLADDFWIAALDQQAQMMGFSPASLFKPDRWLVDGDSVTVGNCRLQVLHCPGHTPGHVVLFSPKAKLAWVGDVLFSGSIGRTDFPKGNRQQLIESITHKLWPLGDDVSFIPGHGPMSTFGRERRYNPFVADKQFG
jgi:glyoxylase-like metal-dependent hydrolase (beta-lactamase superfamily II)